MVGPTGPGRPGQPAGRGRLLAVGAVAVIVVAALVVGIVLAVNRGGTPVDTQAVGDTSTASATPTEATPTEPTPSVNTKFDSAFTSAALRDYVRPYYNEITSCEKTTTGPFASVRCAFDNDVQVALFEIPSNVSVTDLRTEVTPLLPGAHKVTWAHGQLWTGTTSNTPTLYWDQVDDRVAGLALLAHSDLPTLRSWWQTTFGSL